MPTLKYSREGFIFFCAIALADCYQVYQSNIPNGDHIPNPCHKHSVWGGVGHLHSSGGGSRNQFGLDFLEAGKKWTKDLCIKDSDGDGQTNGQELGDPNCTWTEGRVPEHTNVSHPGICEPLHSNLCKHNNMVFGDHISCNRDNKHCHALTEQGLLTKDIRFPMTSVPDAVTSYYCMFFDLPLDGDYHLVATTPLVNNRDIVHHMILFGCPYLDQTDEMKSKSTPFPCVMTPNRKCQQFIGTWTYGVETECGAREAGFRIGRNGYKIAALQVHWNNPERKANLKDNSGLKIYYTPMKRLYDASVFLIGQEYLKIPAFSTGISYRSTLPSVCTKELLQEKIYITRAVNHMHYLGRKQHTCLYRNGSKLRDLADDQDYNYDRPVFHHFDPPVEFLPGDELRTTCVYTSDKPEDTYYGAGTNDEMCFAFITYYPVRNISTMFTSVKSIQRCALKVPSFHGAYRNCNVTEFQDSNSSISKLLQTHFSTNDSCGNYMHSQICNNACARAARELLNHACLQGDLGEYLFANNRKRYEALITCANTADTGTRQQVLFLMFSVLSSVFIRIFQTFYHEA